MGFVSVGLTEPFFCARMLLSKVTDQKISKSKVTLTRQRRYNTMALTRKYLKELGIEPEKIDLIIDAHTDVTNELKTERDALKDKIADLDGLKAENEKLKAETLSENELKTQYEAIKAEYEGYKKDVEAKETLKAKQDAYTELLKELKVSEKAFSKALKLADFDSMDIEDGKLKDADKVTEAIKTEWADFIEETSTEGADVDNPPSGDGSDSKPSIPLIF